MNANIVTIDRPDLYERSEIITDPDSSYWHSLFLGLAGKLFNALGREAYDAWYDAAFPEDDGVVYTWKSKYQAVNAKLAEIIHAANA